jgi:hypothetical protein
MITTQAHVPDFSNPKIEVSFLAKIKKFLSASSNPFNIADLGSVKISFSLKI